jgi:acetyl-CoA carboxylase carboxyl transferase subunit alpha
MFRLDVPIICTVIGEGGSGGALGIGVGDRLLMFEHSVYTVATPEACAAILWRDAGKAHQAASALKITAEDLKELEILDQLLPEPVGGAHSDPLGAASILKEALLQNLETLTQLTNQQRRSCVIRSFVALAFLLSFPLEAVGRVAGCRLQVDKNSCKVGRLKVTLLSVANASLSN